MKVTVPRNHPRYLSLYYRDLLSSGVKMGITSLQGLTAHGRGEAFDYLLGEKTQNFAVTAICESARILVLSKHPVISVNGNTAVLVPKELIKLSRVLAAPLEINLFHKSKIREIKIRNFLVNLGADNILLPDKGLITRLTSNRKIISEKGQKIADTILVPLEDGDRTEYLKKMGKKVITIDLNPLSRTARYADITIVDNIVRTLPLLIKEIQRLKKNEELLLKTDYNNHEVLQKALLFINSRLFKLAPKL
jgi:4-phosphopantoate--beta-alanine ligase